MVEFVFVRFRDLSMILCDPFACNTLVLSIMRNLQELLSQESLPRVSLLLLLSAFTWKRWKSGEN